MSHMNRRPFLKFTTATGVALGLSGASAVEPTSGPILHPTHEMEVMDSAGQCNASLNTWAGGLNPKVF